MPKLSDSQFSVLTAACQRDDGCAFPVTSRLKGNAAGNVLKSLLAKGLLQEVQAERDDTVWRHDEDLGSVTLRATEAGYAALGVEGGHSESERGAPQAPTRRAKAKKARSRPGNATKAAVKPAGARGVGKRTVVAIEPHKTRADTKQASLIFMLRSTDGVTIEEAVKAFGWQSHTVRGALSGALKKKLGLDITSEKVEGRGRIYRIVD